jgi:hypothetical protein
VGEEELTPTTVPISMPGCPLLKDRKLSVCSVGFQYLKGMLIF